MLPSNWRVILPFLCAVLFAADASGQDFGPKPLPLPKDDPPSKRVAAPPANVDPARQIELWRTQADAGDGDAAFELGITMLIGNGVPQDAPGAEMYFKTATMTSARDCLVAEGYVESVLANKLENARRWALAASSSCGYWELAQWYGGIQMGPNAAKQVESLKQGLEAKDDGFRRPIRARLGELILNAPLAPAPLALPSAAPTSAQVGGTLRQRVAWVGEAARQRLGAAEWQIASLYGKHGDEADARSAYLEWIQKSARYGTPPALAEVGQATFTRELSSLSYLDGMAFYDLGARQSILGAVSEEIQRKQLELEQREELLNADALWQRVADESGGYYAKTDPLRAPDAAALDALAATPSGRTPDGRLRLAYRYEMQGELSKAEELYRRVWHSGPAELWLGLADASAKAGKWPMAREFYLGAADYGSRAACAALARVDEQGVAGKKDPVEAYSWLLLSETKDATSLTKLKAALTVEQLKSAALSHARFLLEHREYWTYDVKAVEDTIGTSSPTQMIQFGGPPGPPQPTMEELRTKADAGDAGAAYSYAVGLVFGTRGEQASVAVIEHYAELGAKTEEQKAHIADGYERSPQFDDATRRKYGEKWWLAVSGSRGYYGLAKVYNGKSDGIVKSDDEKKAVEYWRRAVDAGDERWARLSRMELGYRVDKGWTSGDLKLDAAWAHELAMEMMGKEFYQIAGEYSYGQELAHDSNTYLLLAQRAAVYNIDNAQGQLAKGIQLGQWKHGGDADALAWMKLRAVKQDVDVQVVATAEEDPMLKRRIEAAYTLLLQSRADSGAYYPQDDPLRTAGAAELEPRVKEQDPEAQLRLGTVFEAENTPGSLTRAIGLYRQIWATAGQEVRLTWGRKLMEGEAANGSIGSVARDDVGAQKWLWDAANAGSHAACLLLSKIYGEGRGVPPDPVAAEVWRELAGDERGNLNALTADQKNAVWAKVAQWTSSHAGW